MSNEIKLKRKKKKKAGLKYFYLFLVVFVSALFGISYMINSFSPDVDVEIGNKSSLTLNDDDIGMEVKTVDERLKWIQEEDELPSVAIRENKNRVNVNSDNIADAPKVEIKKVKEVIPPPKKPEMDLPKPETKTANNKSAQVVIPAPVPALIKVYVGSYSSLEDAMAMQQKISSDSVDAMPFIKSVNGKYIVQLGSFSKQETADAYISKMRAKGYNPKILQ